MMCVILDRSGDAVGANNTQILTPQENKKGLFLTHTHGNHTLAVACALCHPETQAELCCP